MAQDPKKSETPNNVDENNKKNNSSKKRTSSASLARRIDAEIKKNKREAALLESQGELLESKSNKLLKAAKATGKWAVWAAKWGAIILTVGLLGKGGCEATKKYKKDHPEAADTNPISHIGERATTAVLKGADASAQVAETTANVAQDVAKESKSWFCRPAFLKFVSEVEAGKRGKSWLPGVRTAQVNSWNSNNPEQPLSVEQFETILNTRQYYKEMHNGEVMPASEFYKLVAGVCPSWPKDKTGKVIIRSRVME